MPRNEREAEAAESAPAMFLELPLGKLLQPYAEEQLGFDPDKVPDHVTTKLPLELVKPQIASGKVSVSIADVAAGCEERFHAAFAQSDQGLRVRIPLQDVFRHLPPGSLAPRTNISPAVPQPVTHIFDTPFSIKAREDEQEAAAKAPVRTETPSSMAEPSGTGAPFAAAEPEPAVTGPASSTPASGDRTDGEPPAAMPVLPLGGASAVGSDATSPFASLPTVGGPSPFGSGPSPFGSSAPASASPAGNSSSESEPEPAAPPAAAASGTSASAGAAPFSPFPAFPRGAVSQPATADEAEDVKPSPIPTPPASSSSLAEPRHVSSDAAAGERQQGEPKPEVAPPVAKPAIAQASPSGGGSEASAPSGPFSFPRMPSASEPKPDQPNIAGGGRSAAEGAAPIPARPQFTPAAPGSSADQPSVAPAGPSSGPFSFKPPREAGFPGRPAPVGAAPKPAHAPAAPPESARPPAPAGPSLPEAQGETSPATPKLPSLRPLGGAPLPPSTGATPLAPQSPPTPSFVPAGGLSSDDLLDDDDFEDIDTLPIGTTGGTPKAEGEEEPEPVRSWDEPTADASVAEDAVEPEEDLSFGYVDDESQTALRAVFGTDEKLDVAKAVELSSGLPGIAACVFLSGETTFRAGNTNGSSAFGERAPEVYRNVRSLAAVMGAGDATSFTIRTDHGIMSFFTESEACLGVLHANSGFMPGVREKLTLVARELSRLPLPS